MSVPARPPEGSVSILPRMEAADRLTRLLARWLDTTSP